MSLILASGSPRRAELLRKIYPFEFVIIPADIDEKRVRSSSVRELPRLIAKAKLDKVLATHGGATALAADTVVFLAGELLGKPSNLEEARAMLTRLMGKEHLVVTGYALSFSGRVFAGTSLSRVFIPHLDDKSLAAYLDTGSSLDKAGAYGIQDPLIKAELRSGSYDSVMGLPTIELQKLFAKVGLL